MWQKELDTAREAAKSAGAILRQLAGKIRYVTKKGEKDLVTEADLQAEKTILQVMQRAFPKDSLLAEEGGGLARSSGRTWIIDPLDGTTNFVHGFPFFAVSIGLEADHEMVAGVVYNPALDQLFEAANGSGSFLNGRPIRVSENRSLNQALLATGFPYNIAEDPEPVLTRFRKMILNAQGVRRPGSAAIDMCHVAAGMLDGFWEQDLKPWDTAAGTIILKEAGGRVSTYAGAPYSPYEKTIVASNAHIHEEMIETLNQ